MASVQNGELSIERYESYLKIKRETAYSSLNSRQIENEKINRMFGSKNELKQKMKEIKEKPGITCKKGGQRIALLHAV